MDHSQSPPPQMCAQMMVVSGYCRAASAMWPASLMRGCGAGSVSAQRAQQHHRHAVPHAGFHGGASHLKRVILRRLKLGIADGTVKADGQVIYAATDLKVGLFEPGQSPEATT